MKDIALDDLIKEDKEKKNLNKKGIKRTLKKPNHQKDKPISKNNNKFSKFNNRKDNRNDNRNDNWKHDRNNRNNDRRENRRGRFNNLRRQFNRNAPQTQSNQPQVVREKGRTLKVMGLHPDFTNQDLNNLFASQGALEKCLIQQDNFGRSLTTAIVRYHSAQSAKNAIKNLNNHKVMNSVLTVEPYVRNVRR